MGGGGEVLWNIIMAETLLCVFKYDDLQLRIFLIHVPEGVLSPPPFVDRNDTEYQTIFQTGGSYACHMSAYRLLHACCT